MSFAASHAGYNMTRRRYFPRSFYSGAGGYLSEQSPYLKAWWRGGPFAVIQPIVVGGRPCVVFVGANDG